MMCRLPSKCAARRTKRSNTDMTFSQHASLFVKGAAIVGQARGDSASLVKLVKGKIKRM